jgi:protein TonB
VVALTSSQVQVKYQPPLPPYPRLAQLARIEGTVVVEITIGADGVPLRAQALEGPYQLRAAAEGYALAWRFRPHLENGVAMVARFDLSVRFRLTS